MMHLALALMTQLSANEEYAPRLTTLRFHVERLGAITVPQGLSAEKKAKLDELARRVDAGVENDEHFNGLYRAIDAVRMWLWENAANRPQLPDGSFEETSDAWVVGTPVLTLRLAKADLAMTVETPSHTWQFAPCDNRDVKLDGPVFSLNSASSKKVEAFNTGYSLGWLLTLTDFPKAPGLELRLCANIIGNQIVFELAARENGVVLDHINWPKPVLTGNTAADLAVIPKMQGMLLPGDWSQDIHATDLCNSRSLYMPWWGQIVDGHGVQVILETTDDAGGKYDHPADGPTSIGPRWYASLGKLRYQRMLRYVFDDDATYVTMAKRYRRWVKENGLFVSLDEKRVRTPALNEVIGKPVIHLGALYHFVQEASLFNKDRIENNHALNTFGQLAGGLRQLKASGIEKAYVHLDGWGFYGYDNGHPDVLPVGEEQGGWADLRAFADTCDELGYLFAVHDQYRDFYYNAVSFDDRLTVTRLDGSREEHATWCGGPQTILSPRFAPDYVRRNHDLFAEHGVKVRGAYLDVFAVVPLEESAQSAHPMTRSECAEHRRHCFDLLRTRGYVVSSEEPADYLVRSLDLVHHGPYPTYPNLGGGDATGIPAPLFSLVYHDSILLPWEMGDDGGWGIPKGDAGWLHCLLNAGLPYVGVGAGTEQIARVNEVAELARRCGTQEMVNHEFLDDARRKQRTTFADGTQVTVDFDARTHEISYPGTRKTGLAPEYGTLLKKVTPTRKNAQLVLAPSYKAGQFDSHAIDCPFPFRHEGRFMMTFIGFDGTGYQTGIAESDDLVLWRNRRLLIGRGEKGSFREFNFALTCILRDNDLYGSGELKQIDGHYVGTYHAYPKPGYESGPAAIGFCRSRDLQTWEVDPPSFHCEDGAAWERGGLYKSWILEHASKFYMFYNAKNSTEWPWREQIGLAISDDLVHWERHPDSPLLRVGETGTVDDLFVADPVVLRAGDAWIMFYYMNSSRGHARDGVAFSKDLIHWQKAPKPILDVGPAGSIDSRYAHKPGIFYDAGKLFHFYCAVSPEPSGSIGEVSTTERRGIGLATSQ